MIGLGLYLMCRLLILMLRTLLLLINIPGVVVLFLCINYSKLLLQYLIGFQPVFWVRLTCVLPLLLLYWCVFSRSVFSHSKVCCTVFCSSVSSNIIFMGYDLVDKVKSVCIILGLNYLCTPVLCPAWEDVSCILESYVGSCCILLCAQ